MMRTVKRFAIAAAFIVGLVGAVSAAPASARPSTCGSSHEGTPNVPWNGGWGPGPHCTD